jgi:hypothetical protein
MQYWSTRKRVFHRSSLPITAEYTCGPPGSGRPSSASTLCPRSRAKRSSSAHSIAHQADGEASTASVCSPSQACNASMLVQSRSIDCCHVPSHCLHEARVSPVT